VKNINEAIDDITEEELEINIEQPEQTKESEENNILQEAKKFAGLMEAFDVSAGNMEENLLEEKNKNLKALEVAQNKRGTESIPLDVTRSMIVEEEMINDFTLVRRVLRNTLKKLDLVIDKMGRDMAVTDTDELSAAFITSFSELVKSSNDTAKNLTSTYSTAAKTQVEVKRLLTEVTDMDSTSGNTTNVQNNFLGSPADLLKHLNGGK